MKRLRLLPLLAAVAVFIVTTFTGASAVATTFAPNQQPAIGLPAGKFLVIGAVAQPQILTVADLQAMPSRTIKVTFRSGSGVETHTYVGPAFRRARQGRPTIRFDD
jgi:DMSO/TMAO reductase YedYZ molybdopterin-dependent catalytic subunit